MAAPTEQEIREALDVLHRATDALHEAGLAGAAKAMWDKPRGCVYWLDSDDVPNEKARAALAWGATGA